MHFQRKTQLENKELLLKAFPLIYQTIEDLQFDIEYYIVGNIKVSETFKPHVRLNVIKKSNSIIGRSLHIQVLDTKSFQITNYKDDRGIYYFDTEFDFIDSRLSLSYNKDIFTTKAIPECVIKFKDLNHLTKQFQNQLVIKHDDKKSSVLNLSILQSDQNKGVAFLNKLTQNSHLQKN